MFWFLVLALVVVVAAVTLVVVGGDDGVALPEAQPDRLDDPLPATRAVGRADVEALRFPMALRGYRMTEVDDVLGRLGAELAERDARIAELEAALAGAQAAALGSLGGFRGDERAEGAADGRAEANGGAAERPEAHQDRSAGSGGGPERPDYDRGAGHPGPSEPGQQPGGSGAESR